MPKHVQMAEALLGEVWGLAEADEAPLLTP